VLGGLCSLQPCLTFGGVCRSCKLPTWDGSASQALRGKIRIVWTDRSGLQERQGREGTGVLGKYSAYVGYGMVGYGGINSVAAAAPAARYLHEAVGLCSEACTDVPRRMDHLERAAVHPCTLWRLPWLGCSCPVETLTILPLQPDRHPKAPGHDRVERQTTRAPRLARAAGRRPRRRRRCSGTKTRYASAQWWLLAVAVSLAALRLLAACARCRVQPPSADPVQID
jgi:hypothetical protein